MRLEGQLAWVQVARSGGCGRCSEPGGCGLGKEASGRHDEYCVPNEVDARPGDRVGVVIPDGAALKAAVFAYLIPLAGVLVGAGLPGIFSDDAAAAPLGAAFGLGASLLILLYLGRAGRMRRLRPRMERLLEHRGAS